MWQTIDASLSCCVTYCRAAYNAAHSSHRQLRTSLGMAALESSFATLAVACLLQLSAATIVGLRLYDDACSCQLAVQMADRSSCLQVAAGLQDAFSLRAGHGMVVSRPGSAATALYDPAKVGPATLLACQRCQHTS